MPHSIRARRTTPRRPRLEALEDRCVPASVTVTNAGDDVNGDTLTISGLLANDGGDGVSLREAVLATNNADGDDTITFAADLGPINLTQGELELADADNETRILGPSGGVQVIQRPADSASNFRLFRVAPDVQAVFDSLGLVGGLAEDGGAVLNQGTLSVSRSSFINNTATRDGGAIHNSGSLLVIASTLGGNLAGHKGGGIANLEIANIQNSTLTRNVALSAGGGLFAGPGSGNDLLNVTIAFNHSDFDEDGNGDGGGIDIFGANVSLGNTLVAGNIKGGESSTTPADIGDGFVNDATTFNTLVGDNGTGGSVEHGVNGNITGVNGVGTRPIETILRLEPVFNGGTTQTLMLVEGSAAINAGFDVVGPFDQRGLGFGRSLFG